MTFEVIRRIIVEQIGTDPESITLGSEIKADLGVDSLSVFEIIMELEDAYGLEIPTEDLDGIISVADLVDYIERRRSNDE